MTTFNQRSDVYSNENPFGTNVESIERDTAAIEQPLNFTATAGKPRVIAIAPKKKGILSFLCGATFSLIILGIASIIPLLELFVGWHYKNQCPVNPKIPHFLIIAGAVSLALVIVSAISDVIGTVVVSTVESSLSNENPKCGRTIGAACAGGCGVCCLTIVKLCLNIFCLGWFIAGCFWIFGVWNKVQYGKATRADYCHRILYRFAYWLLILSILYIVYTFVRSVFATRKQKELRNKDGAQLVATSEP